MSYILFIIISSEGQWGPQVTIDTERFLSKKACTEASARVTKEIKGAHPKKAIIFCQRDYT